MMETDYELENSNNIILKYNEIPLKSFSDHSTNQWREFTIEVPNSTSNNKYYRDEVFQKFSSTPYRSGGFNYKKSSLTNGRFIVWRLVNNNTVLELSEHYLHHSLENNQIRIHLINSSIIGDIFIQEFNQDYIIIMFTTLSKSIYRFILPHPNIIEYSDPRVGNKRKTNDDSNRNFKSIFSNLNNSSLDNQWSRVRSVVPESFDMTVIRYFSPTRLIIGSSSSGSVFIELSEVRQGGEISFKRIDCKENQGFFSNWKWGEKQEHVQDIQLFSTTNNNNNNGSYPLAFILQNNSKLRVWSNNEKRFLNDLIIYPESWSNSEEHQHQQQQQQQQQQNDNNNTESSSNQFNQFILSTHKRFKIYPKSNNSFLMVVFFELESESHFQFYSGSLESINGTNLIQYKQERFSFIKAKGLIDFNINNGYLYSLWSQTKDTKNNKFNNNSNQRNTEEDEEDEEEIMGYDDDDQNDNNKKYKERILSLKHIYIGNPESENVNMEFNQFFNSQLSNSIDRLYEQQPHEQQSDSKSGEQSDQSFYFDQLFNRSKFSPISIEYALREYRRQIQDGNQKRGADEDMNGVEDDYNQSLETLVVNTINQEDLRYQSNNQWSIFYKLCVKYQKSLCLQGTGLFIESSSSIIFLIRSNQLSIMKPMSKVECFFSKSIVSSNDHQDNGYYYGGCGEEDNDELFNQIVEQSFGTNQPILVNDLLYLLKCCSYINSYVPDNFRSFEWELSHNAISFAVLSEAEKLITVWENHENFSVGLIKLFQSIQEPINSIERLLEKFNQEFKSHQDMTIQLQQQQNNQNQSQIDKYWSGDLFADILTSCFQQSIEMKYQVLSGLSLLLASISHLRTQLNLESQTVFDLEKDSLPQSLKLLSTYYCLNWFNRQNFIKSLDNNNQDFDKIYLSDNQLIDNHQDIKKDNFIILKNTNILSILINNHLNQFTSKSLFFDNIEIQLNKLLCVLAPHNDVFSLCSYLVEKNQYKHLNEILKVIFNNNLVSTYESGNGGNITQFYYLMGICLSHFSKFNESYQYLIKATESIENENPEMLRICSISRDELICQLFVDVPSTFDNMYTKEQLISNYYFKCIKIFETRNQPELVIQFSLFAIEHLNRNQSEFASELEYNKKLELLYSLIFKYSLKINKFDLAFTAAIQNPNKDLSNENKRRLILTLCEQNEIKDLCSLPFSQKDIEDNLCVLASSQDLNKKPDYHTILYAYYISRCNYRNAAMTFYERSIRINIEGLGKSRGKSIFDQQKLLDTKLELLSTTINTLKLLDPFNQWIDVNSSLLEVKLNINSPSSIKLQSKLFGNDNKSLKHQQQQQQEENREEFKDISIISLKEIEKEYSYYLASKYLSQIDNQINCDFILSPHQLLEELIQNSLFDQAFSLAISQDIDLGAIFQSFALKCTQFQLNPQMNPFVINQKNGSTISFGFDISKYLHFNDNVKIAWKVLEDYLERYDTDQDLDCLSPSKVNENSQKQEEKLLVSNNQQKPIKMIGQVQLGSFLNLDNNSNGGGCSFHLVDTKNFYLDVFYDKRVPPFFKEGEQCIVIGKMEGGKFIADKVLAKNGQVRYHELVADTILGENDLDLPAWLIQWFNNGRQEILFKLYFKYSRLLESSITLISLFNSAINQLNNPTIESITFNIPYDIIDRYLVESKKILKSNSINDKEKQPLDSSIKTLESLIINYLSKLK